MIKKLKIERLIFLVCLIICLLVLVISGLDAEAMQEEIAGLRYQNTKQAAQLLDQERQIEILELVLEHSEEPAPAETYLGEFEITYYCSCTKCCGKTDGITASGTLALEGQTVAADWDILPAGTEIYIDGIGYRTVEDKGGAIVGQFLDVFVNSHAEALELGRHKADVWIVKEKQQ
jgi:3D (Asp-Asp-Asp) domain-containing protein